MWQNPPSFGSGFASISAFHTKARPQKCNGAHMPSFFLTTRNIKRPSGGAAFFGAEPAEPSFVISPDGATTLDPADRETGASRRTRWAEAVMAAADDGDGCGDIVFMVPGFNTDAQDAFKVHNTMARNLRDQGLTKAAFVTYSWPSAGSFANYLEDDSDARETAIHLVKSGIALFAAMTTPGCRIKVHVMAHSMGALVVREAFRAAAGHPQTRENAWGVSQLILYSADISARSLKSSVAQAMFDRSQRFTNYFNRHDAALATANAKRFLSSPRLGRHGVPKDTLDKLVDVDVSDRWSERARSNGEGIFGDARLSHSFYKDDPVFGKDVADTIAGNLDRREIPTREAHDEPGRLLLKTTIGG